MQVRVTEVILDHCTDILVVKFAQNRVLNWFRSQMFEGLELLEKLLCAGSQI